MLSLQILLPNNYELEFILFPDCKMAGFNSSHLLFSTGIIKKKVLQCLNVIPLKTFVLIHILNYMSLNNTYLAGWNAVQFLN